MTTTGNKNIFVTFQPNAVADILESTGSYYPLALPHHEEYKLLKSKFGFNPIFCFKLTTLQDLMVMSFLSHPSFPESVIIFESKEDYPFDFLEWARFLCNEEKLYGRLQRSKLDKVEGHLTEYVVSSITVSDKFSIIRLPVVNRDSPSNNFWDIIHTHIPNLIKKSLSHLSIDYGDDVLIRSPQEVPMKDAETFGNFLSTLHHNAELINQDSLNGFIDFMRRSFVRKK